MGIRETIHDELYPTFYIRIFIYGYGRSMEIRIFIYGYGRSMETRSVERLEPMEIALKSAAYAVDSDDYAPNPLKRLSFRAQPLLRVGMLQHY